MGARILLVNRKIAILLIALVVALLVTRHLAAEPQSKTGCTEANPASLITPANTCGSSSDPCIVDVKRTPESASATPGIAGAKPNRLFAVKVGTTVTWKSTSKGTGFVIDFGASSPFDSPDAITGGTDRAVSVVATKPGCYRYSIGACVSGATFGMCDSKTAELVIVK